MNRLREARPVAVRRRLRRRAGGARVVPARCAGCACQPATSRRCARVAERRADAAVVDAASAAFVMRRHALAGTGRRRRGRLRLRAELRGPQRLARAATRSSTPASPPMSVGRACRRCSQRWLGPLRDRAAWPGARRSPRASACLLVLFAVLAGVPLYARRCASSRRAPRSRRRRGRAAGARSVDDPPRTPGASRPGWRWPMRSRR
ncbi:MAG: hypothetical protein MZW92_28200 [Comamonadaceae bacterium]|nr:hypothetical protein [Comamonadaceae bacterium]